MKRKADLQELKDKLAMLRSKREVSKSNYKEGKEIAQRLISKQEKESKLDAQERSLKKQISQKSLPGRVKGNIGHAVERLANRRMVSRRVLRRSPRATIMVNQPVYLKDKSRFFKEQWEEEKRQLFFS